MTLEGKTSVVSVVATATIAIALWAGVLDAHAGTGIGLAPSSRFGLEVDETTGASVCTTASHDECRTPTRSSGAGGSFYPVSVAADPGTGNVYVVDVAGNRVQEFTATGAFVSMFGWDVNATKSKQAGVRQVERNVCTAASKDTCAVGVPGANAGQLALPVSVAVDATTGDLYVLQSGPGDFRVDRYTRDGRFVWRLGKGVNLNGKGNLCREREIERGEARCGAGAENSSESVEHGAFKSTTQSGNLLAVGGPEHLLYVGDEHRVQVFDTSGRWKREILLASLSSEPHSSVVALALGATGELYLVYRVGAIESYLPTEHADVVYVFNPGGEQVAEHPVISIHPNALNSISAMALDRFGRLAVIGLEVGAGVSWRIGRLFQAGTGALVGEFPTPPDNEGMAFNREGDLYVTTDINRMVVAYAPAPVAELVSSPAPCEVGMERYPPVAFECGLSSAFSDAGVGTLPTRALASAASVTPRKGASAR